MRVCWIVPDRGHYQAARMRALASAGTHTLGVVQLQERSRFREFRASSTAFTGLHHRTLLGPAAAPVRAGLFQHLLYGALDEERPDVLFVNAWSHRSAVLAMAWFMSRQVPFVIVSDSTATDQARVAWREVAKRLLVRRASAAFVRGTRSTQYICALGMSEERVFQGCDAVDNEHFAAGADAARSAAAPARSALHLPDRFPLCVSSLIPRNGVAMLIEAFARYRADRVTASLELIFVGDGPECSRLMQVAIGLDIDRWLHYRGFQGYDILSRFYGLAEALIVPSWSEPWGLVVNAAMASALPVVVYRACGFSHDLVRTGHSGFVIDPTDVNEVTGILRFIDAQPQRMREMGRNASTDIGAWGLGHFVTQCWRAAGAAIATGPSRPSALEIRALELFARTRPGLWSLGCTLGESGPLVAMRGGGFIVYFATSCGLSSTVAFALLTCLRLRFIFRRRYSGSTAFL